MEKTLIRMRYPALDFENDWLGVPYFVDAYDKWMALNSNPVSNKKALAEFEAEYGKPLLSAIRFVHAKWMEESHARHG